MAVIPILAAYMALVIWTVWLLRGLRFNDLTFIDGILIGTAYFLICPLSLALLTGEMPALGLRAEPYRPYEDIGVTLMLFMGWLCVLCTKVTCDKFLRNSRSILPLRPGDLVLACAFYMLCALTSFFLLGKHAAGNWMESASLAYSKDVRAVFFGNASNVMRGAVFGFLILLAERKQIPRTLALVIGAAVVTFDLFSTFNRISAAHFAIMTLILYRSRIWTLLFGAALIAPVASSLSVMWSVARAFLLRGQLNMDSISFGLQMGTKLSNAQNSTVFDRLDGLFEGDNILTFSFIVKNVPQVMEPLWGQTYIIRTFTVFLPAVIWANKPITFGSIVAAKMQAIVNLTLNSTLFGEPYGNFYYMWLPALVLMLLLFQIVFCLFSRISGFASCFALFAGFSAWRYEFSSVTITVMILTIVIGAQLLISFVTRLMGLRMSTPPATPNVVPARV